jgi:gliding motility-associated-like protein
VPSYPSPTVLIDKTPEICGRENGTITLTVTSAAPATVVYRWGDINDTTLSARTGLPKGAYTVLIEDTLCYIDPITIVIDHIPGPVANFEANSYNVASNTIFTLSTDNLSYSPANPPVTLRNWDWDMGDPNTPQTGRVVYYTYSTTGDYEVVLVVTDDNGCKDTISKIIHVYEELNVFIPNMFTPNGDGINDTWKPQMSEYAKEGYQLSVFDRQGQRVFHTTDTQEAWNGVVKGKKVAPNTVYAYRVIVRDFTGQEFEFVGHVTVLE